MEARLNQTSRCGVFALEHSLGVRENYAYLGKAMQHMNSVRVPATIIFTALLVIILVSSSHTTYTLAPARERTALAACGVQPPSVVREAAERRLCPAPAWPSRTLHWPPGAALDSAVRD
jgi:hypothetical protein